jgi:small subunit ribosomal protein S17
MEQKTVAKKRQLTGVVVSDKMTKTRVVEISRLKKHPRYAKYIKVSNRFKAHDKNNEYKTGDTVLIEETRPLSRDKRWTIVKLIKAAEVKEQILEPEVLEVNEELNK